MDAHAHAPHHAAPPAGFNYDAYFLPHEAVQLQAPPSTAAPEPGGKAVAKGRGTPRHTVYTPRDKSPRGTYAILPAPPLWPASPTHALPLVPPSGRWTNDEHVLFLQGLQLHGKEWKKIDKVIKTRSLAQIRSHAQKYFQKLLQAKQAGLIGEGDYQLLMDGKRMATSGCHGLGSDGSIIGLGGNPTHGDGGRKKKKGSRSKKDKATVAVGTKNVTSRLAAHSYPSASSLPTAAFCWSSAFSSCVTPSAASLMVQVLPPPPHLQYSLYESAAASFYHQKQQQQHQDFAASFFPPAPAAAGSECDTGRGPGGHSDGDTSLNPDLTDPSYGSYLVAQPHHQAAQQQHHHHHHQQQEQSCNQSLGTPLYSAMKGREEGGFECPVEEEALLQEQQPQRHHEDAGCGWVGCGCGVCGMSTRARGTL